MASSDSKPRAREVKTSGYEIWGEKNVPHATIMPIAMDSSMSWLHRFLCGSQNKPLMI